VAELIAGSLPKPYNTCGRVSDPPDMESEFTDRELVESVFICVYPRPSLSHPPETLLAGQRLEDATGIDV